MAEQPSPLKSKKLSSSSSQTRNDSENPWLVIPNNLELGGARAKPSKKQRNKEKHRQFQQENLSSPSEVTDSLSCKPKQSIYSFPEAKSNTAIWVKDQYVKGMKSGRTCESEGDYSDPDYHQYHQQNVHFPINQPYSDVEHQESLANPLRSGGENETTKSVQDESKKKEAAMVSEILGHIQEFISEAESSWQKLNLSDEPVIKNAFVKLKKAVKDVEGGRENKVLHKSATENGYDSVLSSSPSVRMTKPKKIVKDSEIPLLFNDKKQDKCNHHYEEKLSQDDVEADTSDDCFTHDPGESVQKVEWARRTIKNKLVQLQEDKKKKDELLKELINLKEAAKAVSSSVTSAKQPKVKERKRKCDLSTAQSHPPFHKRDNVRKEQNSSFPARRHYEAEGRANEEPDIPAGPAPSVSPALDDEDIQYKMRRTRGGHA